MKKGLNAKSFNKVLYVFLGVIVSVTLGLSAYLVYMLNNISRDVSKNKFISMNNNSKIEALAKLEESLKSMAYEESKLEQYIPDDKEVSQILKDWELMAIRNHLSFSVFQAGNNQTKNTSKEKTDGTQTIKSGDFYTFPFQVTLRGSFTEVNIMIAEIEGYRRLAEIKEVKYTKDIALGGDFVEAALQVNAYLKK